MKYIIPLGAFLLGTIITFVVLSLGTTPLIDNAEAKKARVSRLHYATEIISPENSVTCTYPQYLNANFDGEMINHELNKPEENPIIITFTDLTEELVTLRFIDSTQTVNEVSAAKIYEDERKITLVEGLNGAYTTIHTIFLDKSLAVNSKQLDVFGSMVSTSTAIGHCK